MGNLVLTNSNFFLSSASNNSEDIQRRQKEAWMGVIFLRPCQVTLVNDGPSILTQPPGH